MRRSSILILTLLFLILVPLTFSAKFENLQTIHYEIEEEIPDPKPYIQINFGDDPVELAGINSYEINYADSDYDGFTVGGFTASPIAPNADGMSTDYLFSPLSDTYLLSTTYIFNATAEDIDNNIVHVVVEFEVASLSPTVYIENPVNTYFPDDATYAMATNQSFNLTISILERAVDSCRFAFMDTYEQDFDDLDPDNVYDNLYDTTNGFTTNDGGNTFYREDFNMAGRDEGELYVLMVVCEEYTGARFGQQIKIGYDTTPPVISFNAEDVTDPTAPWTTLNATTDDRASCTFTNTLYPESTVYRILFEEPTIQGEESFSTENTILSNFQAVRNNPPAGDPPYYYTFNVTCENIAGNSSSASTQVTLDFVDSLTITTIEPSTYVHERRVPITFNTSMTAVCKLTVNGETEEVESEGRAHTAQTSSLDPGDHIYYIECLSNIGGAAGYADHTGSFIIDNEDPGDINWTSYPEFLCGADEINVEFEAEDLISGIDEYHYIIEHNGEVLVDDTTDDGEIDGYSITAENKDKFKITVSAIDNAGNEGSPSSKTIDYYDMTQDICDRTAPTTSATTDPSPSGEGLIVNISCTDSGSGCQNVVHSYETTPTATCDTTNTSLYTDRSRRVGTPFTITDNIRLCWYVEDNADPENQGFNSITISGNLGITLIEPLFGISPNKTFEFTIETAEAADCRQGEFLNYEGRSAQQIYNSLEARGTITAFDTTGGTTHTVTDFDVLQSTAPENVDDWVIACKNADETLFGKQELELGYDTTHPEITVTLDQDNPIIEPSVDYAQMTVTTNEASLCTYLQPTDSPYPLTGMSSPFRYNFNNPQSNQHSDLLNRDHYAQSFTTRIPEDDTSYFYVAASRTYPYKILCTNLAGIEWEYTYDVIIEPAQTLAVTIGTPDYVQSSSVLVNATTVLTSTCSYSIDGLEAQPLDTNDDLYHYTRSRVSLEESPESYELYIECTSIESDGLAGSAEKDIIIDSQRPSVPEIITVGVTCGLQEEPTIRLQSDDGETGSGIDYYEYELTIDEETTTHTSSNAQIDLPLDTPLTNGDTYGVRARAYDMAGNVGSWSSKSTIEASDENHVSCDETNPFGWTARTDNAQGADVTIHCTDTGSGCKDTYRYAFVDENDDCAQASYRASSSGMTGNAYDDVISVTEDQYLCWQVQDEAGNTFTASNPMNLKVSMDIALLSPRFGIGPETAFDLSYETTEAATCRLGFFNPNSPANLAEWYDQLLIAFDTTGGSTHTITDFDIVAEGANTCSGREECSETMVIICEENNRYHHLIHQVGFDTSDPEFLSAYAAPNPVRTPGNLQSTLHVETDDATRCTYLRTETGESYSFAQNPNPYNKDQYVTQQEKFLGYFNPPSAGQESYTIDYDVTCENYAGRTATRTITITISPTTDVGITVNNDNAYATRTVMLDVTTDLPAECTYTLDPNHPPTEFRTTGSTNHESEKSFSPDDIYNVIIYCKATSGPYEESVTHTMTVDSSGPRMLEIISQQSTCSLDTITARLIGNGSIIGIQGYNYSIADRNGDFVVDWTFAEATGSLSIHESLALTSGNTYKIQAQVIDDFGRKSTITSTSVTARDESYSECDEEPPTASLTITEIYGGVEAYVDCSDDGTGCSSTYGFEHATSSCTGDYQSYRYTNRPLEITSSGTGCAIVYDNAGYNDTDSESFTIIPECSNRIQDPGEEGVDCGGDCIPCDICTNGRQDTQEEGVDCGGVCPRDCDQVCGDGKTQEPEECDTTNTRSCTEFAFYSGTITCGDDCLLDTSGCVPTDPGYCGDGEVQPGEECDGSNVQGFTCEDFKLVGGALTCNNCKLTTANCEGPTGGYCGDGIVGPGERCDGETLHDLSCERFDLISGEIACSDDCSVDTSGCFEGVCGDGKIDRGESCDGLAWGDITSCEDLSEDFVSGTPTCGPDCHFNTRNCVEREGPSTKPKVCLSDSDCRLGQACTDNRCTAKSSGGTGEGAEGQDCTTTADCPVGYDCIANACTQTVIPPPAPPEKHGLGLGLLIAGLILLLAGAGYLVYTTFINPPPAPIVPTTTPGTTGAPGTPGTPGSPVETPEQKAARLAAEKKKLSLQQQARKKAQEEKAQQRKVLLSSFEGDELAEKGKQADTPKKEAHEEEKKTVKKAATKKTTTNKTTKKLTGREDEDVFSELESITKGDIQKPLPKTSEDVFNDLAELSGSSKNKLKTTINKKVTTSDDLVKLFENAERKDVTPKSLTPVLKHFIDKGKLEHATVHETVHKLHEQEKLTHLQKEKILKDLEAIGGTQ